MSSLINQSVVKEEGTICARECEICGEFYNKSKRTPIECMYCCFTACRTCCETYVLDRSTPTCMSADCKKVWPRSFMSQNFTAVFINKDFKAHREQVLFELQLCRLPDTQPLVEEEIQQEITTARVRELDAIISDLKKQKADILVHDMRRRAQPAETKTNTFIRACPGELCRGYLNPQWECGLCEKKTCKACLEIMEEEHECNPDTVETATLLKSDTKPCPVCRTLIFKVSGCDQMWCTQCKTAFSWKSGSIETQIHNPHYYEWRRQNGGMERAVGDVECGRELNQQLFENFHYYIRMMHKSFFQVDLNSCPLGRVIKYIPPIQRISNIFRNLMHLRHIEIPRFSPNYEIKNEQLRIKYLRQKISEEKFKSLIQANDKAQEKNREILQILQLMYTAGCDLMFRIVEMTRSMITEDIDLGILSEFDELILICNRKLFHVTLVYKSTQYLFINDLLFDSYIEDKKVRNG